MSTLAPTRMEDAIESVKSFLRDAGSRDTEFFNESELQHELGYWLRSKLPAGINVYFERPAAWFFPSARGLAARQLAKKDLDLVVAPAVRSWHLAIELKCPRNGRVPETMFDACRDLQFLEQLIRVGFSGGLLLMHVNTVAYCEAGSQSGIYAYFRAGVPLTARVLKPTGRKDGEVTLCNLYSVRRESFGTAGRYWLQAVTNTHSQASR